MTTHHILEIDRPLCPDRLREATEQLVAMYPELSSRVTLEPRPLRFLVAPDRKRIRSLVVVDDDGTAVGLQRWLGRPVPIQHADPFAIRLAPGDIAAQSITLSLHHSLTDGRGALGLFDALLQLAQAGSPAPRSVRSALLRKNMPEPVSPWRDCMRHLAALRRPCALLSDGGDAQVREHRIALRTIEPWTWRRLGHEARRAGVSRNTLLWHAAARSVVAVRRDPPCTHPVRILGPVDLRSRLTVPADALQNWLGTIELDVDPGMSIEDLHAALRHRSSACALATPTLLGALAEHLPPRWATALFRHFDSDRWPATHTLLLTQLRPADGTVWPVALHPKRLWCTSLLPRKPAIGVTVTAVDDIVTVATSWRADMLREATAEAFLERWLTALQEDSRVPFAA